MLHFLLNPLQALHTFPVFIYEYDVSDILSLVSPGGFKDEIICIYWSLFSSSPCKVSSCISFEGNRLTSLKYKQMQAWESRL